MCVLNLQLYPQIQFTIGIGWREIFMNNSLKGNTKNLIDLMNVKRYKNEAINHYFN